MAIELGESGITRVTIIGWVLTVAISLGGAWAAVDARVYNVEGRVNVLKVEISNQQSIQDKQEKSLNEIKDMFMEIKDNITEINGNLKLKADRKYVD